MLNAMKRTLITLLTFISVSAARASDLATTCYFDPTLHREANTMRTIFHLTFSQMAWQQCAVLAVFLAGVLWCYWRYSAKTMPIPPANLREFISYQLFDRFMTPRELFMRFLSWKGPKNRIQGIRFYGMTFCWMIVFGSFLATFSWWAISGWHWNTYRHLRAVGSVFDYPVAELVPMLAFFFLAAYVYWRMEFAEYMRTHQKSK
jgi:hypothetical protein